MKAADVPTLKGGQMITLAYFIGILILLFIVYKVLQKIGLIKTSAEKKAENVQQTAITTMRIEDVFDPTFIKDNMDGYTTLGNTKSDWYAASIHDSIYGYILPQFGTNFEEIFSTFGKMNCKLNISETALAYYQSFSGRDMRADLLNNLSDQHIADLMAMINKLPDKV
jgi:hypothetical protein